MSPEKLQTITALLYISNIIFDVIFINKEILPCFRELAYLKHVALYVVYISNVSFDPL